MLGKLIVALVEVSVQPLENNLAENFNEKDLWSNTILFYGNS